MITDPREAKELRKTTVDLLADNSQQIVLSRSEWVRTPAGGTVPGEPVDQAPMALAFMAVRADAQIVSTANGEMVNASHVLIGMPEDDIRKNDEFVIGNRKFLVRAIEPDRSYQTKAWVIEHAA